MSKSAPLAVWLYGDHVADIRDIDAGRYRMLFTPVALE